jgi:hypothetical protein
MSTGQSVPASARWNQRLAPRAITDASGAGQQGKDRGVSTVLSAGELGNTWRRLRDSAVAPLSRGSGVDRRGKPVLDVLEELGVRPVRVSAGEHGFLAV